MTNTSRNNSRNALGIYHVFYGCLSVSNLQGFSSVLSLLLMFPVLSFGVLVSYFRFYFKSPFLYFLMCFTLPVFTVFPALWLPAQQWFLSPTPCYLPFFVYSSLCVPFCLCWFVVLPCVPSLQPSQCFPLAFWAFFVFFDCLYTFWNGLACFELFLVLTLICLRPASSIWSLI